MKWDVFICHASEDKNEVALPLSMALAKAGVEVWFDEFTLSLGDSLRRTIDHGLAQSRYGVVILSPAFFAKNWLQYELNGLTTRELNSEKVVLPVWHKITRQEIEIHSPPLADKFAVSTEKGLNTVLAEIIRIVQTMPPGDKYKELWNKIKEADEEAEKNKPSPRLESSQIASNLVSLMAHSRQIGREIYSSVLKTEHIVTLTRLLSELQNKIDWYIDLNG